MILAIETSTPVCSVALQHAGSRVWEKRTEGRGVHSEKLFTFTQELLGRASIKINDLDAILFSRGPGSYTGLRIGASAIKGMLFQQNVPLYTFPTLLSFAAGITSDKNFYDIFSVIDARRSHLYFQKLRYEEGSIWIDSSPKAEEISAIDKMLNKDTIITGTGWERLNLEGHERENRFGTETISAGNLIKAWNSSNLRKYFGQTDPQTFEPDYLELAQINNSKIQR
jgi:tRNA threonylcarbamoyladenosine biosynthesis protein TsaB